MVLPGHTGERIGDLRVGKSLSQKELSKIFGITTSQMSRIENGKTPIISSDVIISAAKFFKVSTDFILGLTDIRTPKNYDIAELGLSEGAVKAFISSSVDMQIINRIFEHKRFPYLADLIKRFTDGSIAAGVADQNDMIDFVTSTIGDFIEENPEHKAEAQEDLKYIKSHKLSPNEAVLYKIQSTFMAIVRDVKVEVDEKKEAVPVATKDFMQEIWAQLQDKPRSELTEEDVSEAVANMVSQKTNLDGANLKLFQKMMTGVLKKAGKK